MESLKLKTTREVKELLNDASNEESDVRGYRHHRQQPRSVQCFCAEFTLHCDVEECPPRSRSQACIAARCHRGWTTMAIHAMVLLTMPPQSWGHRPDFRRTSATGVAARPSHAGHARVGMPPNHNRCGSIAHGLRPCFLVHVSPQRSRRHPRLDASMRQCQRRSSCFSEHARPWPELALAVQIQA
jgi:hypothetical protein